MEIRFQNGIKDRLRITTMLMKRLRLSMVIDRPAIRQFTRKMVEVGNEDATVLMYFGTAYTCEHCGVQAWSNVDHHCTFGSDVTITFVDNKEN